MQRSLLVWLVVVLLGVAGCGAGGAPAEDADLGQWPANGLELDPDSDSVVLASPLQVTFDGGLGQDFALYRLEPDADSWELAWHLIAANPGNGNAPTAVRAGESYGVDDFILGSPAELVMPEDDELVGEVGRICHAGTDNHHCTRAFAITD